MVSNYLSYLDPMLLAAKAGGRSIRTEKISVFFAEQITMERRMPYDDFTKLVMGSIRHLSC